MRRSFLVPVLLVAAVGCGGDDGAEPSATTSQGCREATAGAVTVVADALAWDTDCLRVAADVEVTITIDNQDSGVNHNLRVKELPGGAVATKLEPGPVQQELSVLPPAGTYPFVCDIHPNMAGELVARDS